MTEEEVVGVVESILGMDDQGDRSVALDTVRGAVHAMYATIRDLELERAALIETERRLTERNNELFMRIEGRATTEVEEEFDDVVDDVEKLLDPDVLFDNN